MGELSFSCGRTMNRFPWRCASCCRCRLPSRADMTDNKRDAGDDRSARGDDFCQNSRIFGRRCPAAEERLAGRESRRCISLNSLKRFRNAATFGIYRYDFVPLLVVLSHVCELIPAVPFLEPEDGLPAKYAVALPTFGFDRLRIPKTSLHFRAEDRVAFLHEISFR